MQLPPIKVFNTLTGQKEDFRPSNPPRVNMYVCGITPYSTSHFGHGMSAVNFDMIRRHLIFRGYDVRYVQNFTDIDDKIINRASELGEDARTLPERYIDEYLESMRKLNVLRATVNPRTVRLVRRLFFRAHFLLGSRSGCGHVLVKFTLSRASRRTSYAKSATGALLTDVPTTYDSFWLGR